MKRRTKIVCTLGPAVDSKDKIEELIDAGMNVARLNCSHGDWDAKARWIEWIRELSPKVAPVAILADLQGPKFRLGDIAGGQVEIARGQTIVVGPDPDATLPVFQDDILRAMSSGARLLIGDGEIEVRLGQPRQNSFEAKVLSGGIVKSRKGLTLVGKVFDTPSLTEKDLQDLDMATACGVDIVALSYVKDAADVRELRRELDKRDKSVRMCAKIETKSAVKGIDGILEIANFVMVARGDLGLQMDFEDVPFAQKAVIGAALRYGRPVITATQMLESMIVNPRPTRAEATDIANAVLDGTDALMLSGETAMGAYPVECVKTMASIAEVAEGEFDDHHLERAFEERWRSKPSLTDSIAHAAAQMADQLKPKAIIATTTSGQTARMVAKFRPSCPILCATWDKRTLNALSVVWGVEAIHIPLPDNTDDVIETAIQAFFREKRLKTGDLVIVTAGVPAGTSGNTNMIFAKTV